MMMTTHVYNEDHFFGSTFSEVDFWVRWDPLLVARRDLLDLSTRPFSAPTPPSSFRNPLGLQFVWKMASRPCSFMIVKTKWNTSWSASSMLFGKTKKHNVLIQTKWCFRGHGSHSRKDPQKTIISFEYNYHQIQEKKPSQNLSKFETSFTALSHFIDPKDLNFLLGLTSITSKGTFKMKFPAVFRWRVTFFSPL